MGNNEPANSGDTGKQKEILGRLTAYLSGVATLLVAIAAVLGALGKIDFTSVLSMFSLDE